MKKFFVGARVALSVLAAILVAAMVLALALAGCGSAPARTEAAAAVSAAAGGVSLDEAIAQAAERMETRLPTGSKVALISVSSPSQTFSKYVLDRLEAVLVNSGKLVVVDRANLDKIREEQGFQASGEVSDESAKAIGKLIGADAIVTGSLVSLGSLYQLTLKAINMESAVVAASHQADIAADERVRALLTADGGTAAPAVQAAPAQNSKPAPAPAAPAPVAQTPVAPAAPSVQAPSPAAPAQSEKTYKIGDTGPGGGMVFYDKGNYRDGWRFLECAPASAEETARWSGISFNLSGTQTGVGTGKRNTELIVAALERRGESGRAAQICDELVFGGYDDWFLPSKDELNRMYTYLKKKGLGGFSDNWYWSSSESSETHAWNQSFSDGFQGTSNKYYGYHLKYNNYADCSVRAVRAF
ncbi:MAG: DUF1566 domain-containing protein [Treponematales bacterium]